MPISSSETLPLFVLVLAVLYAGCAPQAATTQSVIEPTAMSAEAPATTKTIAPNETPTFAAGEPVDLNVFAGASLTEPFTEVGKAFEAGHPGVTSVFNFAGS
jgi:ABC-type molybdate transport system substrate-binding protein